MSVSPSFTRRVTAMLAMLALLLALGACYGATSSWATITCGSSGCLPGIGYTLDTQWNCGAINSDNGVVCYANGTTISGNAVSHTFSWGSADYDGTGTINICISGDHANSLSGCGYNLVRSCYYESCNDQSFDVFKVYVSNYTGTHTVLGHAKA